MVVDTSALLARAFFEPEAERFVELLDGTDVRLISAASLLEAGIVDDLIVKLGLEVEPVTVEQVRLARRAYREFSKGNHPASLNFGGCFAYASPRTWVFRSCSRGTTSHRPTSSRLDE